MCHTSRSKLLNFIEESASGCFPQPIKREYPRQPLVAISEPQKWVPPSAAVGSSRPPSQAPKKTDACQHSLGHVASGERVVDTPQNSSHHVASGVEVKEMKGPRLPISQECKKIQENVSCKKPKPETKQENIAQDCVSQVQKAWETLTMKGKSYSVLSVLGTGGSSKVYQVFDRENSKLYAMKVVDLSQADLAMQTSYRNEIALLQKLQGSELVIKLHGYEHRPEMKKLFILLEKGETDLALLLKNVTKSKPLHAIHIKSYWLEMLMAVAEIHKAGVIHSDLKPANFLFVSGRLKLIDFGIANAIQGDMTSIFKETLVGTCNYMAPEVMQSTPCSNGEARYKVKQKSDVWSLGCILYNMVYGHTPFHHITNMMAKLHAITNASYQIHFPEIPDPQLLDVLKICLNRDPNLRPSIEDLIRHPYLLEGNTAISLSMNIDAICIHLQKVLTPKRMKIVSQVLDTVKK